ncbi:site-2 protease family protein [Dactylosporangium sp. AC04546]|uniref:site-2 protease family protein n=1 Tax=Dactylosporangium sp. AC04546 TaxID=2862460 RepID=UPI001EDF141E|nr:site-2 protease family protein [Dactylosporangium sp. AC04546]WVK78552.1 site-2 protease family protein [Dactylosporangium sp. AC04546]
MTSSFRLGRVAGVEVGANWSVLIVLALIAWLLAAGRLPAGYPGRPAWAYAVAGILAAVVFLLGLLAHEASHAVFARRNGLDVEGITLWVFGGVARLRGEPSTPGAEARIAGAGPAVSLLIGLVFAAVAAVLAAAGRPGLVLGTARWLAGINLLLAAFNLFPAAPLDGGRLLRAGLWKWRGDRVWATVAAARTGQAFGVALIAFGLGQMLLGAAIGGLWLLLIGWFIVSAAAGEQRQARLGSALAGIRVADVMTPDPVTVPAGLTVADFVDHRLREARHSTLPLVDGAGPAGLITLARIERVPQSQRASTTLRAAACPMSEVPVAGPDDAIVDLIPRLSGSTDRRALVVDDGRLVGVVSPRDVQRVVRCAVLRRPAARG